MPIHSNPPRTVAGNRIDPTLARGLVNQALREADARVIRKKLKAPEGLGNETARRRFVHRMTKAMGPCGLGTIVSKSCLRVAIGCLSTAVLTEGWKGLAVTQEIWNLDPKHPENPLPGDYKFEGIEMEAFVDKHVLARIAQRRGETTLDGFLGALSPVWGWCRLANQAAIRGVFHVPVAEGMICCERNVLTADGEKISEKPVTRIMTYLDAREMNAFNRDAWHRLVAEGALDLQPRFPRLSSATETETRLLGAMRREGAAWEERRDFAQRQNIASRARLEEGSAEMFP